MILDLREFEEFPAETTLTEKAGVVAPFRDDVLSVGAVTVALTIQQSGEEYFVQGSLNTVAQIECARCLTPIALAIEGSLEFIVTTPALREQQAAEAVDAEEYVFMDGATLTVDVTEPVREAMLLELPMKPLCREECQGLCPRCGVNRNEESCGCITKQTDPRWEGLKKVTEQSGPEKRNK